MDGQMDEWIKPSVTYYNNEKKHTHTQSRQKLQQSIQTKTSHQSFHIHMTCVSISSESPEDQGQENPLQ